MLKKYIFILFNIVFIVGLGKVMDLLGTPDSISVLIGVLLLAGLPFIYIFGLKRFGYYEYISKLLKDFRDIASGEL